METKFKKNFEEKELQINISLNGYDLLASIHLMLFSKRYNGFNNIKRFPNNSDEAKGVDECVNDLFALDLSESSELIATEIAKNISILYLYQPFYDGNSRTLLFFLKYLISRHQPESIWELDDINIKNIPYYSIFYEKNEMPTCKNVSFIQDILKLTKKRFR